VAAIRSLRVIFHGLLRGLLRGKSAAFLHIFANPAACLFPFSASPFALDRRGMLEEHMQMRKS
jgi:hypothetical protein